MLVLKVLILFPRRCGDSRFGGNLGKSEKSSFLVQKQGAQAKVCVDTNQPTYVGIIRAVHPARPFTSRVRARFEPPNSNRKCVRQNRTDEASALPLPIISAAASPSSLIPPQRRRRSSARSSADSCAPLRAAPPLVRPPGFPRPTQLAGNALQLLLCAWSISARLVLDSHRTHLR